MFSESFRAGSGAPPALPTSNHPVRCLPNNYAHNNESRVHSSNAHTELERLRLYYDSGFYDIPLEGCCDHSFQVSNPTQGIGVGGIDCFPGGILMATDVTCSSASSSIHGLSNLVSNSSTREICKSGSKRQRRGEVETFHNPLKSKVSPSSHDAQRAKAPVKKSQRLGDKITALQQLVSPFGKTDTASVLQEATICIKILHEQIQVLSAPYFQRKSSYGILQKIYSSDQGVQDLQSRGLCLVPISTIVSLANQRSS